MEREFDTKEKETKRKSLREWEFANEIYIFCPDSNKGIMFYDQSPSGPVAKFSGYLPEGKFWSSKEKIVTWNNRVNGVKPKDVPVSAVSSFVVNAEKFAAKRTQSYGGGWSSYHAITIMVSTENFMKIVHQLEKGNRKRNETGYTIIDINSSIFRYDPKRKKINNEEQRNDNIVTNAPKYDENINLYTEYTTLNNRRKH